MIRNWQFHFMVIIGLIIGVFSVFYLTGSLDEQTAENKTTTIKADAPLIWVEEASWGLNCIDSIQQNSRLLKKELDAARGQAYEKLQERYKKLPPIPYRNNVLELVSIECNDKESCEFVPSWEFFNMKQYNSRSCNSSFTLEVRYRCKRYGNYLTTQTREGDIITLNCAPTTEETSDSE